MRQAYHLDTSYFIEFLENRKRSTERTRFAYRKIKNLKSRDFSVKISELALGEAARKLALKKAAFTIEDLEGALKPGEIEVFHLEKDRLDRFIDLVNASKKINYKIQAQDILILAIAICDEECLGLLTFDHELIGNKEIKDFVNKEAKDRKRFVITSEP